jgi:hypothetical protein
VEPPDDGKGVFPLVLFVDVVGPPPVVLDDGAVVVLQVDTQQGGEDGVRVGVRRVSVGARGFGLSWWLFSEGEPGGVSPPTLGALYKSLNLQRLLNL